MAAYEKDEMPMLSDNHPRSSNDIVNSAFERFGRTQSASFAISMNSTESYASEPNLVGHTGPLRSQRTPFIPMSGPLNVRQPNNLLRPSRSVAVKKEAESRVEKIPATNGTDQNDWPNYSFAGKNEHLLRSGQLGMCNDPYCTTCPTHYYYNGAKQRYSKASGIFDSQDHKCIVINWPMTSVMVSFRSLYDIIYLLHILLQFKLAYVAPESRVVGAGELVDHPKKIARNYLHGYFFLDLFNVLPLPQIMILLIVPKSLGLSGANYAKNLLRAAILVQYGPRLYRFLPLLAGQSPSGFIFESAWANFIINLLTFVLSGHVVGSCWYLFGLQRVNQCLRNACHDSQIEPCMKFIDCGHGDNIDGFNKSYPTWTNWIDNINATSCFSTDGFPYGIYIQAVNLTMERSVITRYVYSLFWGFQQISTLAGNQTPSYFVWEVLFTMTIIGLGLLLFALLIGNMQNFLQALGKRRLEMSLRRRDVEQWMSHRRLPEELRRRVRQAERYNWAATRGVNEEILLENLPEDLQRDIRRHLFMFIKKVRIFSLMDEHILDAICERLRQKTYIGGSKILYRGCLIEKMVFIVRGKMESIGEDGIVVPLSEGDVCGEELLTWCLEHYSVNKDGKKIRLPGQRLLSTRSVQCLTNVEVFSLRAADIEEVTSLFLRFLRNPRVQGAIRYESPYWRGLAATRIQVQWRYRKKRLSRAKISQPNHSSTQ
ncbi:probable cyclic nucleotide-gated ion channel 20, chloroplastic isoform X3 [Ziziphus jujuba]|uniref:Probable cyclic nucleotide-gated ion channel 20, chloroplastic isoform X3 n=1 Tax=Ziziphus jujuba TaxID=326968 RepID=A0ABM4A253_ZIZJJ|nr:probable cyclic nucleotide-gated ion channel 20, chloroplastic isoform X3 [Ziziphus jujuba]